ncbi:hypothetical protein Tco_1163231 [Tanacetum coccineum]
MIHLSMRSPHGVMRRFFQQGRKFSKEGFKDDEGGHEKASTETELFIQEITPTEVIHEQEGSGKSSDQISTAGKKKDTASEEVPPYKLQKKIDWNDPSVLRYHSLKLKPKSIAQARRNMVKYLKNQGNFKMTDFKGMSYNEVRPVFEKIWDFNQKFVPLDAENASKKQKSPEKEKSPEKDMKRKKLLLKIKKKKMDVEQLFRLVKERYSSSAPEGFDLMLWGDLHTLFEPDEDDEIWKDQHEYNLLN